MDIDLECLINITYIIIIKNPYFTNTRKFCLIFLKLFFIFEV